ncbi:hypothetical protein Tco_0218992 [Tanacetum coccineum]
MSILHSFEENKLEYEDEDEVKIKMMGTGMDKESLAHNLHKNDITPIICHNFSLTSNPPIKPKDSGIFKKSNFFTDHEDGVRINPDGIARLYLMRRSLGGGLIRYKAYGNLYVMTALGWLLEEIHMTWAYLEKKQTRLPLYTKSDEENSHTVAGDGVMVFHEGVRISCDTVRIITRRRQDFGDIAERDCSCLIGVGIRSHRVIHIFAGDYGIVFAAMTGHRVCNIMLNFVLKFDLIAAGLAGHYGVVFAAAMFWIFF